MTKIVPNAGMIWWWRWLVMYRTQFHHLSNRSLTFKTLPLPNNCYGSRTDVWRQQDRVLQRGWQMHAVGSSHDRAYLVTFCITALRNALRFQ